MYLGTSAYVMANRHKTFSNTYLPGTAIENVTGFYESCKAFAKGRLRNVYFFESADNGFRGSSSVAGVSGPKIQ
jgi:hypothetical protein